MPSWRRVFHSREAWIESMAGQCPPPHPAEGFIRTWPWGDWPFAEPPPYPADDEGREVPDE
jgi:hypothetical protein